VDFRDRVSALMDGILAQTLLTQEIARRATVTAQDVERYYAAHQDDYAEPAGTFIAQILCRDESHARDVIRRIESGASFEDIAKAESMDVRTREQFGILADPVPADGDFVPLFGSNQALHDALRNADAGSILPEPYQSSAGWHVIKVMSHRQRVDRPLDDIRDQVRRDTLAARQQEVTEQYIAELFESYKVQLYPQVFGAAANGTETDTTP
jgi:parvulin-like peptidyl-prolyl isomerase